MVRESAPKGAVMRKEICAYTVEDISTHNRAIAMYIDALNNEIGAIVISDINYISIKKAQKDAHLKTRIVLNK